MEWLRAHPFVSGVVLVCILIGVGAVVVLNRSPVSPANSGITWSGGSPTPASQDANVYGQSPQQIAQEVVQGGTAENVTIPTLPVASSSTAEPTSGSFDYETLLAQLSTPVSQSDVNVQASATSSESYALIPATLVATSSSQSMTATQDALYNYGNEVGGEIESFENLHTNQAEVIKDQAEDRTDPTKAAAVVSLGQALASVGKFMQQMQGVPTAAQPFHAALAQSYLDIGAKLQLVTQAQTDAQFVQAVENYDTAADTFVQNYAALAQFLSAQGVTFSQQDPGSVFSFNNASL